MAAKDIEAGRAHVLISIRDRMTQGLKAAEQKLQAFGRSVAVGAGVVTAGVGAGLAWPLKLAANMESTQVAFEVMLGSGEKAKQMLADIEKMGAETPFTFDQLKDAGQMLLNFNVDANKLLPTMKSIGDVAAGDADKFSRLSLAYGQTTAKGRLMGQEVNQMVEAGFNPLAEIARTTGRSMKDLTDDMEDGKLSAAMLQNAFITASSSGGKFDGMMAKQSQTLSGLMSTLIDNAAMVARAFGDTLVPTLKTFINVGITIAKIVTNWVKENKAVIGIVAAVAAGVFGIGAAFVALGGAVMAGSFVVGLLASGFGALMTVLSVVFSPVGALIAGLIGLGVAAIAGLIGLGVAAYMFRDQIFEALAPVIAFFQPVLDKVSELWTLFQQTFNGIVSALASGQIETAGRIAWDGLLAITLTATSRIIDLMMSMLGTVGKAIMSGNWSLAGAIAMAKLWIVVANGADKVKFVWSAMALGMAEVFDRILYGIQRIMRSMVSGILQSVMFLQEKIYGLMAALEAFDAKISGRANIGAWKDKVNEVVAARQKLASGAAQKTADAEQSQRSEARFQVFAGGENKRQFASRQRQAYLSQLEQQANAGYQAAGNPTGASLAAAARANLAATLTQAKTEQAALKDKGAKAAAPALNAVNNVVPSTEKKATAGTFSAVGALLLGTSR
ncbi:MAG: tape measure protein, partial [Terricaulis sp.]